MMCVSALGTLTGVASWPVIQVIQDRVNSLVTRAVTLINALTIGLVMLMLRLARTRAAASPSSVWAQTRAYSTSRHSSHSSHFQSAARRSSATSIGTFSSSFARICRSYAGRGRTRSCARSAAYADAA